MLHMGKRMGTIGYLTNRAIDISLKTNESVTFEFNGVDIVVTKDSVLNLDKCEEIQVKIRSEKTEKPEKVYLDNY